MNRFSASGLCLCFVLLFSLLPFEIIVAQPFTRVSDGPVAEDIRNSRSICWVDYDGDLDMDLFVSNSGQGNQMYQNRGDGTFLAVDAGDIGVNDGESDGASFADCDNDGDPDLFVVNWYGENNKFYLNQGDGTFTRITEGDFVNNGGHSETCSWADLNGDGYVDLYVTNSAGNRSNYLYMNQGDGNLQRDYTSELVLHTASSRGIVFTDWNHDGLVDAFVANESNERNHLFENIGSGVFSRVQSGPVHDEMRNTMTGSFADYDNDGDLDLFTGNLSNQANYLYENQGDGTFQLASDSTFIREEGWTFGSTWGDYDNDGDLDLFVANGYGPNTSTTQQNYLFENNGDGSFERVMTSPFTDDEGWSFGAAWCDYDMDGDLDLAVARWWQSNQANLLYRNEQTSANHWLAISCEGTETNRSAIGAVVRAKATINSEPVWQMRTVSGQEGYCGQNLRLHFGLGDASGVDSLVIRWPSGVEDVYENVGIDQLILVVENSGYSDVEQKRSQIPVEFHLGQNYPNPFNASTFIRFRLSRPGSVRMSVFNVNGVTVADMGEFYRDTGEHRIQWHADQLPSGTYFVRMQNHGEELIRRATLLK